MKVKPEKKGGGWKSFQVQWPPPLKLPKKKGGYNVNNLIQIHYKAMCLNKDTALIKIIIIKSQN